jgi:hypothetical protein
MKRTRLGIRPGSFPAVLYVVVQGDLLENPPS